MSAQPHKIVYVIDDLGYGGAQRQLTLLAESLPDSIVPVVASLSRITEPFADRLRKADIEVIAAHRSGGFDLSRLNLLRRVIREHQPDLVHGYLDASNTYGYLAARWCGVPFVASLRNDHVETGGVRGAATRFAHRHAQGVIVNSQAGAVTLEQDMGVARDRIYVILNGFDFMAAPGPRPASPSPLVGYVGRFTKQKRVDRLVDAFAALRAEMPQARLMLVGAGPELGLVERRIAELDLTDAVDIHPPRPDIAALMSEFQCMVLPSAYEGTPNVAIEAIALGVPVVTAAVGDVTTVVDDGRTGVIVSQQSPQALRDGMLRVLRDDPEIARIAASDGAATMRTRFAPERMVAETVAAYQSILARK